jgi:cytochrome d ubiquinol oxidase subunit I
MVGIGLLMIVVSWVAAWRLRRDAPAPRAVLRALAFMTYAGWIATLAGWYTTEIGRQPWLVYGALAVAEAVAPHPPATVASTFVAYAALYAFLLASYVLTLRYLATKPAKSLRMLQPVAKPLVAETR